MGEELSVDIGAGQKAGERGSDGASGEERGEQRGAGERRDQTKPPQRRSRLSQEPEAAPAEDYAGGDRTDDSRRDG